MAQPKMLKLREVLEEIDMSRAAFYRMRARGQAPASASSRTGSYVFAAQTSMPGGRRANKTPPDPPTDKDHERARRSGGGPSPYGRTMLTYDVEFWAIRERKGRPKPFELRWRVGTRAHSKSYKLSTQADGRRSELLGALRARQQFDVDTGLPVDELAALTEPTWYEHALAYVLMKWPRAAAKHRAGIAEALAVVSPSWSPPLGEPRTARFCGTRSTDGRFGRSQPLTDRSSPASPMKTHRRRSPLPWPGWRRTP